MLFSRRTPPDWKEKLRVAVWPRRSWARSSSYVLKRILRLTATPHSIAAGVAAGVFASFTPFMGLHFLIAFAIAWAIGGNMIASALGTFVGNPLTFPLIWASTFSLGGFILNGSGGFGSGRPHALSQLDAGLTGGGITAIPDKIVALWDPMLKPMTIGGIPLGVCCAIFFYLLTRWATVRFREARQARLAAKGSRQQAGAR